MNNKIKKIIADSLKVSLDIVTDDLAVGDIPEWDSLAHVRLITELEVAMGIELDVEQALDIEDVTDLVEAFAKDKSD